MLSIHHFSRLQIAIFVCFRFAVSVLTNMNGAWVTPEWEAATMALEKLQTEKSNNVSSSGETPTVKSTSASGASTTTTTQNTMSYNASFYSPYYAMYQHPYAAYDMYGYGPYGPYGYMPFTGPMQPPPPPPPSTKSEPKSESSDEQSQAASTTAVSSSTSATSNSSDRASAAGKEVAASSASATENTWANNSTSAVYSYPGNPWQPYVGMTSSAAGMWPNTACPRPKASGATGYQSTETTVSLGSGSWPHSAASSGAAGRFSAGAARPSRPSAPTAMPSLRWSNSPRVNPYDGLFRQSVPKHGSEPYSPFDPTESEECEDQFSNSGQFGGFSPAPDAGNFRFRMPNRRACRPMQWRQQSPRPNYRPEMQSPPRVPMQQSPNWRYGQRFGQQQQTPRPAEGSAGARPVYMPRTRALWSASPDAQKMQNMASKPDKLQESRRDNEAISNRANADNSSARSSAESGTVDPADAEWPMALKQFVHRCFSSVKDDRAKDVMETQLKALLTKAFGDGTALTHEWDHEPIPDISNSCPSFQSLGSPPPSDRYGRPSSQLCSPRNFKFAGSVRGRQSTPSSSSRRDQGWSPPGFRRRARSRSHSRKSRSRSSSRSSSSSRHSTRTRRRRRQRRHRRDSRYNSGVLQLLLLMIIYKK